MADNNLLIEKNETESKTVTTVKTLDFDEKITEIVRLVGGVDSDSAILLAKELVEDANNYKKSL
jgi:DNA repair ATPase RecN